MGSTLLNQVHASLPKITTPCPSKPGIVLCFSVPSSFRVNTPPKSLSWNGLGSRTVPLIRNKRFIVKAESNSEEEQSVIEDGDSQNPSSDEISETQVESPPRKPRIKLGDIMGILNKRAIEASEKERPVPDIRTGDVVEIKLEVPENRRRASIYKGIVISKQNAGIHTTIRIRRIIAGIGVEIVFPVYSPNIKEIKVLSHRKVRRARLYYLRDKLPRLSTFK